MSRYDEQFADAAAQLCDDLADSVRYTRVGGAAFDISIIVGPEEIVETNEEDGVKRQYVRECSIPITDRAAGAAHFCRWPLLRTFLPSRALYTT